MSKTMEKWFQDSMDSVPYASSTFTANPEEMARKCHVALEKSPLADFQLPMIPDSHGVLLGMEIEVEKLMNPETGEFPQAISGRFLPALIWRVEQDGSLRNSGLEFISRVMTPKALCQALTILDGYLNKVSPQAEASWRTSIHVHCNVRDMTSEQFIRFVVLYLIFEGSLFRYAAPHRRKSNFCVPLLESDLTLEAIILGWKASMKAEWIPYDLRDYWDKYSALGINQLHKYGTLEFRHMPGDRDMPKLYGWIGLISMLRNAALSISSDKLLDTVVKINTMSHYGQFREEVFKEYSTLLSLPKFEDDIAHGVLRIKEHLFYTPTKNLLKAKNGVSEFVKKVKGREANREAAKKEERQQSYINNESLPPNNFIFNTSVGLSSVNITDTPFFAGQGVSLYSVDDVEIPIPDWNAIGHPGMEHLTMTAQKEAAKSYHEFVFVNGGYHGWTNPITGNYTP